ncbi:MAG: hypothetical protein K0R75_1586 [Paenibacillaceae bacterium]|nr:hypothetical protein [Paenibacillaceae bacterium]
MWWLRCSSWEGVKVGSAGKFMQKRRNLSLLLDKLGKCLQICSFSEHLARNWQQFGKKTVEMQAFDSRHKQLKQKTAKTQVFLSGVGEKGGAHNFTHLKVLAIYPSWMQAPRNRVTHRHANRTSERGCCGGSTRPPTHRSRDTRSIPPYRPATS